MKLLVLVLFGIACLGLVSLRRYDPIRGIYGLECSDL